jgi:hypothetical protein
MALLDESNQAFIRDTEQFLSRMTPIILEYEIGSQWALALMIIRGLSKLPNTLAKQAMAGTLKEIIKELEGV